jgi:ABC-type polysaccharide/polyol phosphate export permease
MFFLTPIIYSLSIFPENLANLLKFNPMAVVMDGARSSLIYGIYPSLSDIIYIYIGAITILIAGLIVFHHYEWRFGEEL